MRFLTVEGAERKIIEEQAENWLASHRPLFNQVEATVKPAIAEYIANQQGLTLFCRESSEIPDKKLD